MALPLILIMAFAAFFALAAADNMRPVIISVSLVNGFRDAPINTSVTATFSKDMDASSINADTFLLRQRTTPVTGEEKSISLQGNVNYNSETRTASFTPIDPIWPSQAYGNVFTATITTGVTDDAGNSLEHTYIWSFTTGLDRYNTGATTSQQNQTASLITPLLATPPAAPPTGQVPVITTAPAASASWWLSPYALAVYLLILLLIAYLLYLLLTASPTTVQSKRKSPFGDIHPVSDVEGIGPEHTKQLGKLNIYTTRQLWKANAEKVAAHLGIGVQTVQHWQQMAELMAVKGIGPQYAELLERSGVGSIEELAASDPDKLLKQVQMKQDSLEVNIQGNPPGHAIVASWIDAANDHQTRMGTKGET